MSLAKKALLVSVQISKWDGRKRDKRATKTVEDEYRTKGKVGGYNKKLLPGASELADIIAQSQAMYVWLKKNTSPWCNEGTRILASKNYLEFTKEFNKRKATWDKTVSEFLKAYPELQETAKKKLGKLYREDEYPSAARIREKFKCEIAFFPIPETGDFRVEIPASEKAAFEKQMKDIEANVARDCWERVHEVVSKAAEKLASPKAIFRDSLVENITECCTLLSKLNVTDDPKLETMRREVEKLAASISPDSCRASEHSRQDAAAKLSEVMAKMGSFMGK